MKNKLRNRLIALALSGVMIFSGSSSALADSPAGEIIESEIVQEQSIDEEVEAEETVVEEETTEEAEVEETVVEEETEVEETVVEEETTEETTEETEVVVEETQPTIVETVVGAVQSAAETVVEVVETIIEYIIGMHDDLTYMDDQVIIKVYAEQDEIIPKGTKIKVVPILQDNEETKEQYEEVAAQLEEKVAEDAQVVEGFLAYDITLVDPEGNEYEPTGEVKVSIEYKKATLPTEVEVSEEANVTVHHFEEDANGEVAQIVDMVAEETIEANVTVTEASEVEKVEFVTESFSKFTITWTRNYYQLKATVHCVCKDGNQYIDIPEQELARDDISTNDSLVDLHQFAPSGEGYTFIEARLDGVTGDLARYISRSSNNLSYSTTQSGYEPWDTLSYPEKTKEIYFIYEKDFFVSSTILNFTGSTVETKNISLVEGTPYELNNMGNITKDGHTYTYESAYVKTSTGEKVVVTSILYQGEVYYYIKSDGTQAAFAEGDSLYLRYAGGPVTAAMLNSRGNAFDTKAISVATGATYTLSSVGNVTKGGYTYTYESAYVETAAKEKVDVTSISNQNGKYYYVKADGTQAEFTEGDNLYLRYSGGPATIDTVNSLEQNINISLTDYSMWGSDKKSWSHNVMYNINDGHKFKFFQSGQQNATPSYNAYTGGKKANQGIVDNNLNSGYPYLTGEESLKYLFDTAGKTYYQANHLFKMEDGYFVYNSNANAAEFDTITKNFTVYQNAKEEFFPFNKYTDVVQVGSETDNDTQVANYHFGMHVDFTFMQPANGKIGTQDMIFQFNGDDDVWVFIDGMLVLDLGGIHQEVGGIINFATGDVTFDATTQGVKPTTIYEMFKAAWVEQGKNEAEINELSERYFIQEEDGSYKRFKSYTKHTLDFFYLERGAYYTNCLIRFNLASIPEDSITVEKEITQTNMADFADATFKFKIETSNYDVDEATYSDRSSLANKAYKLYEVNGTTKTYIGDGETNENGEFSLKHRQLAEFSSIPATTKYWVTELDVVTSEYGGVIFNETPIARNDQNQLIGDFSTGELLAQDCVYVKFQNACNVYNKRNLVINKVMNNAPQDGEEFDIKVEFADGEEWIPYVGSYYVGKTQKEALESAPETTDDGIITLEAGESAYILGLISDTKYQVTEVFRDGQEQNYVAPLYSGTGRDGASTEPISDTIELEEKDSEDNLVTVYTATVTNAPKTKTVNVVKNWVDSNMNHENDEVYVGLYTTDGTTLTATDKEPQLLQLVNGTWQATFSNLPIQNQYDVRELVQNNNSEVDSHFTINGEGYIATYDYYTIGDNDYAVSYQPPVVEELLTTVTITNTLLKKVPVEKQWFDNDNVLGLRPNNISVSLMQGNQKVGESVLLSAGNNWKHTFDKLPMNDANGNEIQYTVVEDVVPNGYKVEYTSDESGNGVIIKNAFGVQLMKCSSSDPGKLILEGAIFKLTQIVDQGESAKTYYAKSTTNGISAWHETYTPGAEQELTNQVNNLEDGNYLLSEEKAPNGYALSIEEWTVEVRNGVFVKITTSNGVLTPKAFVQNYGTANQKTVYAVYFENTAIYELPSTGGFGIYVPMIGGVLMMMTAALILLNNKRREVLAR